MLGHFSGAADDKYWIDVSVRLQQSGEVLVGGDLLRMLIIICIHRTDTTTYDV